MYKRIGLVVAVTLLLSVGLAGIWLLGQATAPPVAHAAQESPNYSASQTITVLGQGSVRLEPNIAKASIGLETMGQTVSEAVEANGTKMASILAALKEAGIAEKDIQTMSYSVNLDRSAEPMARAGDSVEDEPQPMYRVSNMVNVTIRDLDKVSETLDAAIAAGANNIWGMNFSLEDSTAAQAEARAKAVEDAQSRAQALADLGGVELGPVMSMSEIVGGGISPMPMAVSERAIAGAGPISPGEVGVGYQIQVTYFIEP